MEEKKIEVYRTKVLGEGCYGTMYLGKFKGQEVAVKRVPLNKVNEEDEGAMQKLNHPNIVKLLHFESDLNFRWYALELCVASLDQLFLESNNPQKYNGRMPRDIEVFLQLASGLEYIHSQNVIHRDINTKNVLISVRHNGSHEEVTIKWADFGLSRTVNERGTYTISKTKGTQKWFAPEILRLLKEGKEYRGTVKSDVFAQGLVFGCLLMNGQHLYGSTGHEIENNIINNDPINLQKIDSKIREFFANELLTKMLKDDPFERMSSSEVVIHLTSIKEKFAEKEEELRTLCARDSKLDLIETIKNFVGLGIDVNAKGNNGWNALHHLCFNNSSLNLKDAIEMLIQSGIDVNAKDNDGWNALHIFCEFISSSNLLKLLPILIENGLNLHEKTESGKNAFNFLVNKKTEKDFKLNIFRFLIRHGVQINGNYKANPQLYQDFFKENDNCGKICFDLLVEEGISFGWHPSCEHCQQILSIEKNARLGLQHHQMFSNCYLVFHFLKDDLEKRVLSTAKGVDPQQDMKDKTKWLLQLAEQYQPSSASDKSYKEDFELMAEVGEQVKDESDSSQFNCDNYERYLRSMKSIAEMTNSKESIEEIQWFYLLPFDFPIDYGNEKESDTKQAKMEWDKTLFSWAHKITDKDYGKFMKEDANEGFFLPKEFKHNCHAGQSFNKQNSTRSVELANQEKEGELRQLCARDSPLDLTAKMNHLIDFGIDVNAKDGKGRNALHRICRTNSSSNLTDVIQMLIKCGIDVHAKDKSEHNALHILCEKNSSPKLSDSIKMLIESGMDLGAKDNNGRNALHVLCLNNRSSNLSDAIKMLVQCGIDVDAKDYAGRNASDYLPAYLSDAIPIIKTATSSQTTERKNEEPQPDGVGKRRRAN